ncbi:MAG: hypothetical protein PHY46_04610, partial [Candidatus Omnitrophica bacterium]|nr:hypothetical protein [Candidatus Omnitrophota bacterium]
MLAALEFEQKHSYWPWVPEVMLAATEREPQAAIIYAQNYAGKDFGRDVYLLAAKGTPEIALSNIYKVISQPWARDVVKSAPPVLALKYLPNYIKQSWGPEIFESVVKDLSSRVSGYEDIVKYTPADYISHPRVRKVLREALDNLNSYEALSFANRYITQPWGREIFEQKANDFINYRFGKSGYADISTGDMLHEVFGSAATKLLLSEEPPQQIRALLKDLSKSEIPAVSEVSQTYYEAYKLGIKWVDRFSKLSDLKEIIANRLNSQKDNRPLAAVLFPAVENKEEFFWAFNWITPWTYDAFKEKNYRIMYYEIGMPDVPGNVISSLKDVVQHAGKPADVIIFGAHSYPDEMDFADWYRESGKLTLNDEAQLKKASIRNSLAKNGQIVLIGCSTGEGESGGNNFANMFSRVFPQAQRIFAPTSTSDRPYFYFIEGTNILYWVNFKGATTYTYYGSSVGSSPIAADRMAMEVRGKSLIQQQAANPTYAVGKQAIASSPLAEPVYTPYKTLVGNEAAEFKGLARDFVDNVLNKYVSDIEEIVIRPLLAMDLANVDKVKLGEIYTSLLQKVIEPFNTLNNSKDDLTGTQYEKYKEVSAVINNLTRGAIGADLSSIDIVNKGFATLGLNLQMAMMTTNVEKHLKSVLKSFSIMKTIVGAFDNWLQSQDEIILVKNEDGFQFINIDKASLAKIASLYAISSSPIAKQEIYAKVLRNLSRLFKEIPNIGSWSCLPRSIILKNIISRQDFGLTDNAVVVMQVDGMNFGGHYWVYDAQNRYILDVFANNNPILPEGLRPKDGILILNTDSEEFNQYKEYYNGNVVGTAVGPNVTYLPGFESLQGLILEGNYYSLALNLARDILAREGAISGSSPIAEQQAIIASSSMSSGSLKKIIVPAIVAAGLTFSSLSSGQEAKTAVNQEAKPAVSAQKAETTSEYMKFNLPAETPYRMLLSIDFNEGLRILVRKLSNPPEDFPGFEAFVKSILYGELDNITSELKKGNLERVRTVLVALSDIDPQAVYDRIPEFKDQPWSGPIILKVQRKLGKVYPSGTQNKDTSKSTGSSPIVEQAALVRINNIGRVDYSSVAGIGSFGIGGGAQTISMGGNSTQGMSPFTRGDRLGGGVENIREKVRRNLLAPYSPVKENAGDTQPTPASKVPATPIAPVMPINATQSSPLQSININIGNLLQTALPIHTSYIVSDPLALVGFNSSSLAIAMSSPMNASNCRSPGVFEQLGSFSASKYAELQEKTTTASGILYNLSNLSSPLAYNGLGRNSLKSKIERISGSPS